MSVQRSGYPVVIAKSSVSLTRMFGGTMYMQWIRRPGTTGSMIWILLPVLDPLDWVEAWGLNLQRTPPFQTNEGPILEIVTLYTFSASAGNSYSKRAALYGKSNDLMTYRSGEVARIVSLIASALLRRGKSGSIVMMEFMSWKAGVVPSCPRPLIPAAVVIV